MKKQTFYRMLSIALVAAMIGSGSVGTVNAFADDTYDSAYQSLALDNTSYVESESIPFGSSVVMHGSATGGSGDYTYAFYYKQQSAENWGGFSFGSESEKSFKPTKETTYNICIKVKDSSGTVAVKYFDVEVKNTFVNTSTISAEKISLGEEVVMYGSATGGVGDYTYAYYYKQQNAENWGVIGFSENTSASFKPTKETTYNICIKTKDSAGNIDVKYFDVEVENNFVNTSTISAENILLGEEVIMYGSATGGIGDCTYAYYYKQAGSESWGGLGFSENTSASFKPTKETTYNICIKAKDSTGTVDVKYFDVEVKNNFVNTSTISAENISLGEEVVMYGSSTGGIGDCTYAYFYKQASADKWGGLNFSENTSASFKPTKETTYNVCIKVKDSAGKIAVQYFDVEVKNTLSNTATVDKQKINFGEKVTVKSSAKGGSGQYFYQYLYKVSSANSWSVYEDYSENAEMEFIPESPATYDIMVRIKDFNGITADSEIFTVEVENTFANTSTINAENISLGEEVVMYGSSTGGIGDCTYAYYYKQASADKWGGFGFSTETEKSFKPTKETTYNICIKAKDSTGTVTVKYFDVEVKNNFVNTSTISAENISLGEEVVMYGSATGGIGDCTYAYFYKQASTEKWGGLNFSENTSASFKPTKETTYNICIKAKDSAGKIAVQYFDVEVKNTLSNTATVDKQKINFGEKVTVKSSAKGGSGQYFYQYLYKVSSANTWSVYEDYSENAEIEFIPESPAIYDIMVRVKDFNGITADSEVFTVEVENTFANTSTVSAESISLGEEVVMYGSSTGGIGDCTYAYYYKQASADKWGGFGFSTETEKSFKPTKETTYNICIKAKDSTGTVTVKYFDVEVKNNFVNTSTISAESISLGEEVVMYGSSTGGIGDCTYAYFYKQASADKWGGLNFSENTSASFKPTKETTYNVCIKVKDSAGKIAVQYFDVEVKNTLSNTATVDKQKINFGEKVTVKSSAKGGSGQYFYQYLYKVSSANTWSVYEDYSENAEIDFIPESPAIYDIMVRVKDFNGITADSEIFTVEVENTFANTSTVSAESISLGEEVVMYGSSTGGIGECTYAYYYKQASAEKWGGFGFSTETEKSFKPTKETTYNICIKAKDSTGTVTVKYFDVEVKNNFVNTSTISAESISLGEEVVMYGSATGGIGDCTYAYFYKQASADKWGGLNFSENTSASFKPTKETTYNICIKAKDSTGTVAVKYFDVEVKNNFVNTSTISAESISLGEEVVMYGSSTGGIGDCTYAYYYKQASTEKWGGFGFSSETEKSFKPTKETTYNICIKVKDSAGKIAVQYFDVEVKNTLVNTSSVDTDKIAFGEIFTVKGSATGGSGQYMYQYLYRISASNWSIYEDYSQNAETDFVPEISAAYEIMVRVKDSNGITADSEIFTVEVENTFKNTSTVSAKSIILGEDVVMYGSAVGGIGNYTYAYYYKQADVAKWGGFGFSSAKIKSFKPVKETTYNVCIKVKDSSGTIDAKYFDVEVKNNIVNTSRIEKDKFSCGEPVHLYGSATGGSGVYSYAFTYKQKDEENFRLIRNYAPDSEETFSIRDEGDYIFRITVQDSNGVFADEKLFEVKVENTLVNDSYVEAEAISKGQDLIMHGAAHGGSGEYTYKFFYKKPEDEKYNSKQALEDDETTAVIKPNTESIYNILIRATDSYGKTIDKYIDVKVGTPVTSTSSVNSYNIKIGNAVTVTCSGKDGSGKYEYQFLYGKTDESGDISLENMTVISDFSSTNSARVVLDEFGTYKVVSIVRDSNGSQDMKYHMIQVSELSNVSKLSKSLIERGAGITIYGRSTGGKGTVKYAYQYKLVTETNWKTLKGYSTKTSVSFTPEELGTYEIRILAKDELKTVSKVLNLTVKKPKSEEITDAVLPNILNDSMSDFEKVIAIHDWIVNNIEYDMEHYYDAVPPSWDSTAEGAYDNRKALCGGYAKLFRLLANTAGFEVKIITGQAYGVGGTTEAHEWNRIKIGDNWYNVDVTMDDPVSTSTKINNLRYTYLLVPDSAVSSTHFTDNTSESCTAPQPMDKIEPAIAGNISKDTGRKTYICKTNSSIKSAFKDASSKNLKQFQILYKSSETSASKISTVIRNNATANASITPSICTYAEGYWSVRVVFS